MKFSVELSTQEETESFAASIAAVCSSLDSRLAIHLIGDLGAGKTTFSRGFIQALGYSGRVKSPTYTLVEPYDINGRVIFHFDLYRLADPEELEFVGIRDYGEGNSISLIEWPSKGEGFLPNPNICINIAFTDSGRLITIEGLDPVGEKVVQQLEEK